MFEVYYKVTNKKVKVYSVQNDKNGYPKFLVNVGNEWKWMSAKHFRSEHQEIECDHEWDLEYVEPNGRENEVYKCKKCGDTKYV